MKKIILTALIIFLFFHNGFCQQPTKTQIDKMMKDAKAMLSKIQQQAKDAPSFHTTPQKKTEIKHVFPIVLIHLKQPLQIPTEAQAKDHLLWYKGKKMNDSMIVTTKGMLVLYSKKKDKVTAQPLEKNDPFRSLVINLSKTTQMTDDYINQEAAKKNSPMNYPIIQGAVDEFEDIDDRLNAVVKNTIDLSVPPLTQSAPVKPKSGAETNLPPKGNLSEMHRQLKQLLLHKPALNFDAPPKRNLSLAYLCDENAQKHYNEEWKKWEEGLLAYEDELIRTAMKIQRYLVLTGTEPDTSTDPAATSITNDMEEAYNVGLSRSDDKIKLLTAQDGKDIFMQDCVISAILKNERKKQLLGMGNETDGMTVATELLESPEFENYINEQIERKNWDVIFNMAITLGRERQAQLMGTHGTAERLNKLVQRIQKLNRFALTADVDFNIQLPDAGKPDLKFSGTIQTTDKVYVCLARSGCKWTLMLSEPDFENAKLADRYIPMQVTAGVKSVKDDKEKWTDYPYSGPKEILLHPPVIRIDFSDEGQQDSATLGLLTYLPNENLPVYSPSSYTIELLAVMNNVFIDVSKVEANTDKMMDLVTEMMAKFAPITNMSASNTPLERLKKGHLVMEQKQEAEQKTAAVSFSPKAVILFNAPVNSSILIDERVDTKHKDKEVEVTRGIIKLKVVHEPLKN